MFAEVIVDVSTNTLDKIFDYECPKNQIILLGQRVLVPFGNRTIQGYVLNLKETTSLNKNQIKQILKPLDNFAIIIPEMLNLIFELKNIYNLRIIDILHLIVPSQIRSGKVKSQTETFCYLTSFGMEHLNKIKANSKNQISACGYLKNVASESIVKLKKQFGNATINKLIEKGFLSFLIKFYQNKNLLICCLV